MSNFGRTLRLTLSLSLVIAGLSMIGCAQKQISNCPQWPEPAVGVMDKIISLDDPAVDDWLWALGNLEINLKRREGKK